MHLAPKRDMNCACLVQGWKLCAHARNSCANAHARQNNRCPCGVVVKIVRSKRKLLLCDSFSQNSPDVSVQGDAFSCSGVMSVRTDGLNDFIRHASMRTRLTMSVEQDFVRSKYLLIDSRNSPYFMRTGGSLPCSEKASHLFLF